MREVNVYLSGPMDNVSEEIAFMWREDVERTCRIHGKFLGIKINVINPCRGVIVKDGKIIGIEGLKSKRECMQRDRTDILNSDIIFCNLSVPNRPYFGTAREVEFSKNIGITLIGFYETHECVIQSPWMQDFFYLTKSYEDSLYILKRAIQVYAHRDSKKFEDLFFSLNEEVWERKKKEVLFNEA